MFEELEKKQINKNNSTQISPPATPPLINQGDISKHKNEHEDKQEIEDIFADIEKADTLKIKNTQNGFKKEEDVSNNKKESIKKILFLLSFLIIFILIIGGFFLAYKLVFNNKQEEQQIPFEDLKEENAPIESMQNTSTNQKQVQIEPLSGQTEQKNKENEIIESSKALLDTDQDGLTDEEELGLGLNINKNDSDDDGLFDREELRVYKTDPLNKDTDGDGYLDGAEVKNGFNPNGAGRLYDIN
ncbi:hypothetical protein A2331_06940 [Candidatus Falkowbacteria bacterium RIFOXYB2_FULL_34_18]|uniref:EF-hand domain-containing protein n=1 Tax=Candidatus Falkowbacteria bacterium RIFOXYD2_FULL_34_120 TaxID=1798007 RepID=A0A1F5TRU5_9BACT|nr:MAG: hypothetical protein A2331_06940 [Candidatus Falkowbacteria bacterium RIFOXYB2_FULL_34_18]OGF29942.1 MAG: hypothetical protein A2500_03735 [Candidatus Falkowbacteria bacterium RIFOXYC12_FULL_34_55]OGF37200.1 MAG: hypothetical protein A2466_02780 [Candidatus Falkowbacteria bacterium RIFOXYC2_FULL_34_220]OGF39480.1 MAG: hypothetical protein A2515_04110 [Candidatus Falkowbacteria bacterium RIFOXYD12_FULL_34_57]OGF41538.1 MAG: hypothetical protein A2531_02495 [Candidatus Falkowbacteria bact